MMLGIFGKRDSVEILLWLSLPTAAREQMFKDCDGMIERLTLGDLAKATKEARGR